MTKEKAVELAIENGYPRQFKLGRALELDPIAGAEEIGHRICPWEEIWLDPQFWKCLAKAMGWPKQVFSYGKKFIPADKVDSWLYHWHRFIDHLADGKEAVDFFKNLK